MNYCEFVKFLYSLKKLKHHCRFTCRTSSDVPITVGSSYKPAVMSIITVSLCFYLAVMMAITVGV